MRTRIALMAIASLVATTSMALAQNDITSSRNGRLVYAAPQASMKLSPAHIGESQAATIYSNLAAAYPKGLFNSEIGTSVYGPGASGGRPQSVAATFTPSTSATAVAIKVAVQAFPSTQSTFVVSIYSDKGGVPGQALSATAATATSVFGNCCGIVTVRFKGVALTGGTPYWVVLGTSKSQTNSDVVWNQETVDQVDQTNIGFNDGNGWQLIPMTIGLAFGVFSQ